MKRQKVQNIGKLQKRNFDLFHVLSAKDAENAHTMNVTVCSDSMNRGYKILLCLDVFAFINFQCFCSHKLLVSVVMLSSQAFSVLTKRALANAATVIK